MNSEKENYSRKVQTALCRRIKTDNQCKHHEQTLIASTDKCELFLSSVGLNTQIESLQSQHQQFKRIVSLSKSKYQKNTINCFQNDMEQSSKKQHLKYKRGRNQDRQKFAKMEKQMHKLQNFLNCIPNLTIRQLFEYRQIYLASYLDDFIKILGNQCQQKANFLQKLWNLVMKIINSLLERIIKKFRKEQQFNLKASIEVHNQYQKVLFQHKQSVDKVKQSNQKQIRLIKSLSQSLKRKKRQLKLLSGGINYCSQKISEIKQKYENLRSDHIEILVTGHSGMSRQQAETLLSQKDDIAETFNSIYNFNQKGGGGKQLKRKIRESVVSRINQQIKNDEELLQQVNVIMQETGQAQSQQQIPLNSTIRFAQKTFKVAGVQTVQLKSKKQANSSFSQSFNCFDKFQQQLTKNRGSQTVNEKVNIRTSPLTYSDLYAKKWDKFKIQATVGFKYKGLYPKSPSKGKQYEAKVIFISAVNTMKSIHSVRQMDENQQSPQKIEMREPKQFIGEKYQEKQCTLDIKQQQFKSRKNVKKYSSNIFHRKMNSNLSRIQNKPRNSKSVEKGKSFQASHIRIKTQGNAKKQTVNKIQLVEYNTFSGDNIKTNYLNDKNRPKSSIINTKQVKRVTKLSKQQLGNHIKSTIRKQTKLKFNMKKFFQKILVLNQTIYANQTIEQILKYNAQQLKAKQLQNLQKIKQQQNNLKIDLGQSLNMYFVNRKVRRSINQIPKNRKRSSLIIPQRTLKKGIQDVHRMAYILLKNRKLKINFMQLLKQSVEREYFNLKAQQTQNKRLLFMESLILYASNNYFYRNFLLLSSVFSHYENHNIVFSTDVVFYLNLLEKLNCNQKQIKNFQDCYTTVAKLNEVIQNFVKQYYPFRSLVQYIQQSIGSILVPGISEHTKLDIYKCCNLIISETLKLKVQILKSYEVLITSVKSQKQLNSDKQQNKFISLNQDCYRVNKVAKDGKQFKKLSQYNNFNVKQDFFRQLTQFLFYPKLGYLKLFNRFRKLCGTEQISIECLANFLMNQAIPQFDKLALSNSFYFDMNINSQLNYQSEDYKKMRKYFQKKSSNKSVQNSSNKITRLMMNDQQTLIPPSHALTLVKMMITQKQASLVLERIMGSHLVQFYAMTICELQSYENHSKPQTYNLREMMNAEFSN